MINQVIDLSHHNGVVDLEKAKASGIIGIIHKATQGISFTDPSYDQNYNQALGSLMWGAYHFGINHDGVEQAKHFLDFVGDTTRKLLVLDFERNSINPADSMTLQQARDFCLYIWKNTGHYPGLYTGNYIKELLGNGKDIILQNCWLWIARYASQPIAAGPCFQQSWPVWTMWQYTDGTVGNEPREVPGIGACDRDIFNGTIDQLIKLWWRN